MKQINKRIKLLEKNNRIFEKEANFCCNCQRYKAVYDFSSQAIGILDKKGVILDINNRVYDWLGYKPSEIIGRHILKAPFLTKQGKAEILKNFSKRIAGKNPPPYEVDFIAKNGKRIIGRVLGAPIFDKKKKIVGDVVMVCDITESKEAERALADSERKLRFLFEKVPVGIGVADLKGNILRGNQTMIKITGYTLDEIKKINLADTYVNPKERLKLIKRLQKEKQVRDFGVELKRKDGSIYFALLNVDLVEIDDRKIIVTTARDFTEHREMEEKIEIKDTAIESSVNPIGFADLNGIITYVNPSFVKMWGYENKKEILGRPAADFWQTREKASRVIRILKKQGSWIGELTAKRKNNLTFEAELSATMIKDRSGKPICLMGSFTDISERKQIERAKTEFVSLASHQLRTPLTSISWQTELLLKNDFGGINKKQRTYLRNIYESNRRLVKLVNALLNVSRIELGTFSINPRLVNIIRIAENVLNEFSKQIKDKQLKIRKSFDRDLPVIKLDSNLIHIIFQNLLSNSIKYTPQEGSIRFSIKAKNPDLLIQVSDTGCGIPQDQQSRIFTKFFRADNIREREQDGNGLGLYIVKSVVEQSRGKIWFKSRQDKGAVFYVQIPLKGMKNRKGTKQLL